MAFVGVKETTRPAWLARRTINLLASGEQTVVWRGHRGCLARMQETVNLLAASSEGLGGARFLSVPVGRGRHEVVWYADGEMRPVAFFTGERS